MTATDRINEKSKDRQEFKIELDSSAGNGLQQGMDVLHQVFGGFVQSIQDAVGPEMLGNMQAAQWLAQLSDSLEQIANGLRDSGTVAAELLGQLAFYLDQWDDALKGSRLEATQATLRERLQRAEDAIAQLDGTNAAEQSAVIAQAAGYFRAAAKSVLPLPGGEETGS